MLRIFAGESTRVAKMRVGEFMSDHPAGKVDRAASQRALQDDRTARASAASAKLHRDVEHFSGLEIADAEGWIFNQIAENRARQSPKHFGRARSDRYIKGEAVKP
jgi:hypothetical protein